MAEVCCSKPVPATLNMKRYMHMIKTIKDQFTRHADWRCRKYSISDSIIEIKCGYDIVFLKTFIIPLEKLIINKCVLYGRAYACLLFTENHAGIIMFADLNKDKVITYSENLINEIKAKYSGPLSIK